MTKPRTTFSLSDLINSSRTLRWQMRLMLAVVYALALIASVVGARQAVDYAELVHFNPALHVLQVDSRTHDNGATFEALTDQDQRDIQAALGAKGAGNTVTWVARAYIGMEASTADATESVFVYGLSPAIMQRLGISTGGESSGVMYRYSPADHPRAPGTLTVPHVSVTSSGYSSDTAIERPFTNVFTLDHSIATILSPGDPSSVALVSTDDFAAIADEVFSKGKPDDPSLTELVLNERSTLWVSVPESTTIDELAKDLAARGFTTVNPLAAFEDLPDTLMRNAVLLLAFGAISLIATLALALHQARAFMSLSGHDLGILRFHGFSPADVSDAYASRLRRDLLPLVSVLGACALAAYPWVVTGAASWWGFLALACFAVILPIAALAVLLGKAVWRGVADAAMRTNRQAHDMR